MSNPAAICVLCKTNDDVDFYADDWGYCLQCRHAYERGADAVKTVVLDLIGEWERQEEEPEKVIAKIRFQLARKDGES